MDDKSAYEAVVIAAANKTALTGGAVAASSGAAVKISWIAAHGSEIAAVCAMVGAAVAVAGLVVSIVFQLRRDRRELAESVERRKNARRGADVHH